MLCVLPVYAGDLFLLLNLLRWIKELGGCAGHSALIVADAGLPWDRCQTAARLAEASFDSVQVITNGQTVPGWVAGSNSLWLTAARHAEACNVNGWLWLEPDAVPLRKDWLDELEAAWKNVRGKFMGALYQCSQASLPHSMMSGVAIYPHDAANFYPAGTEAFDVQLSRAVPEQIDATELIQHFWGLPGVPPTFRITKKNAPLHAFTLEKLDPAAVVFHRQKDGTLIDMLRSRAGFSEPMQPLVVLPVCSKDAALMLKLLAWIAELDGQNPFDCLLSYDSTVEGIALVQLRQAAGRAFRSVLEFSYNRPAREAPPDGPAHAFAATAQYIHSHLHRPWLWLEADCVPLKADWLPTLWLEYQNCGCPVMGPVIKAMGHVNGSPTFYPGNLPELSPRSVNVPHGQAWDTHMTGDLIGKVHDSARLCQHAWGLGADGMPSEHTGSPLQFSSPLAVKQWIRPEAVIFHRDKNFGLVDQLRKMRK